MLRGLSQSHLIFCHSLTSWRGGIGAGMIFHFEPSELCLLCFQHVEHKTEKNTEL